MDKATLDQAYENGAYIPDGASYGPRWEAAAAAFRAETPCELDIRYGDHPRAAYDLFFPQGASKGLMVFVHGGYWRMRSKSDWSHFARGGLARGFTVALIGYPLAPEVRIAEITTHVADACAQIAGRIDGAIYLAGHSAGGHLVSRLSMPGVLPDDVAGRVVRSLPISGVSDLRPLMGLSMNEELKLDADEAVSESPALGQKLGSIGLTALVGAEERPVFLDQNRWLAEAWDCPEIILPGRHHFDVLDGLEDPNSTLMSALFGDLREPPAGCI